MLVLIVEVCKIITGYAPPIMGEFFVFGENTHNLRNFQSKLNKNKKALIYDLETISYRSSLLCANANSQVLWENLNQKWKVVNLMYGSVLYVDLSFRI